VARTFPSIDEWNTALSLNNRVKWSENVPHNSTITNLLLSGIPILFAGVGAQEVMARLR
jgi:hypothetical protein